jgi:hypothetical protein
MERVWLPIAMETHLTEVEMACRDPTPVEGRIMATMGTYYGCG